MDLDVNVLVVLLQLQHGEDLQLARATKALALALHGMKGNMIA
eukprot:COSAG06_NODE_36573_length_445_cov_1.049133_2_plen_42_part_01